MQGVIIRAVLVGLIAGLLVGVYHNIFTVPVIERSIMLEEERAAAELPPGAQPEEEPPLVSLGAQRIGMALGTAIVGAVLGLVFAGAYGLLRWTLPEINPVALAITAGLLGFWAISFLTFVKYPFVPPGVGEDSSLISRQAYQLLFFFLSALGVAGLLLGLNEIRNSVQSEVRRQQFYALAVALYGVFLLVVFALLPNNPDPVNVPATLFLRFNALSLLGHLLLWGFLSAGFAYLLQSRRRAALAQGG